MLKMLNMQFLETPEKQNVKPVRQKCKNKINAFCKFPISFVHFYELCFCIWLFCMLQVVCKFRALSGIFDILESGRQEVEHFQKRILEAFFLRLLYLCPGLPSLIVMYVYDYADIIIYPYRCICTCMCLYPHA